MGSETTGTGPILAHAEGSREQALRALLAGIALVAGAWLDPGPGIYYAISAFAMGALTQTLWLAWRVRSVAPELDIRWNRTEAAQPGVS